MMRNLTIMTMLIVVLCIAPNGFAAEGINLSAGGDGQQARIVDPVDGTMALLMILASVLTAWCLNYTSPRVRVFGSVLAALGCLAVFIWFVGFVIGTGFLENPKPHQTPLDAAKPALLWTQAIIALGAGVFLLAVAYRQAVGPNQAYLALTNDNGPQRFGHISRLLHWTTAILFLALIPLGIFGTIIPIDTPFRSAYYVVHESIGITVLALLVIRLFWHRLSQRPALDNALTTIERRLAKGVHGGLYILLLAMPVTGFVMTTFHGFGTLFLFWELPPQWAPSDSLTIVFGTFHKYLLPYLLYIILGAHILGVIKHHFIDKHGAALKRMVG